MNQAEENIAQVIRRQQQVWNATNAAGYARDCAEEMTFTYIIGRTYFGKNAFEEGHVFIFTRFFKGSTLDMQLKRIYFSTPDVALVAVHTRITGYRGLLLGVAS
jgi:uncharacterized protein (TIGR02246 family)